MTTKVNAFDQARRRAEMARNAALRRWQKLTPELAKSATHRQAFMAGYEAGAGPLPISQEEFVAQLALQIKATAEERRQRLAKLPAGTCPDCEGEGFFESALHSTKCENCNGTGLVSSKEGGAA